MPAHCRNVILRSRNAPEQSKIYGWLRDHRDIQLSLVQEGLKRHASLPRDRALDQQIGVKFLGGERRSGFRRWCLDCGCWLGSDGSGSRNRAGVLGGYGTARRMGTSAGRRRDRHSSTGALHCCRSGTRNVSPRRRNTPQQPLACASLPDTGRSGNATQRIWHRFGRSWRPSRRDKCRRPCFTNWVVCMGTASHRAAPISLARS